MCKNKYLLHTYKHKTLSVKCSKRSLHIRPCRAPANRPIAFLRRIKTHQKSDVTSQKELEEEETIPIPTENRIHISLDIQPNLKTQNCLIIYAVYV